MAFFGCSESKVGEGRMHQSTDAKKSHGKGTDRHTNGQTSQLLDQIGPVGRFGENTTLKYSLKLRR